MWKGRFKQDMSAIVKDFTQSLDIDWRMAECDIQGSLAHVKMLGAAGLLKADEAEKIELGLRKVLEEIKAGRVQVRGISRYIIGAGVFRGFRKM